MAAHNLVTFKSHHEALDEWALWELVGHFVNYRKQSSPALDELLPLDDFRLLAVSARFPQSLARRVELSKVSAGAYEAAGPALRIRIIVANELPRTEHNVLLHVFSASEERLR